MDEIIDLTSDAFFMGEALRQAQKAFVAEDVFAGCDDGVVQGLEADGAFVTAVNA